MSATVQKAQVEIATTPEAEAWLPVGKDLVLAWARDIETKAPRYIGELSPDQTGQKCGCECYSCDLPLEAVNAGKTEWHKRPHFRHPDGAPRKDCLILSARAAALQMLLEQGELLLPKRRKSASVEGLSGNYHDAFVEARSELVRISEYKMEDRVNALLKLHDGRILRVSLVGKVEAESQEDDHIVLTPTIKLIVDDPAVASMSPEDLRNQIAVIIDDGHWCTHWQDAELEADALANAKSNAEYELDWLDPDLYPLGDISDSLKWETLLHYKAKETLENSKQIRLPELKVVVRQELPNGKVTERTSCRAEQLVELTNIHVEKHLGEIKPDVLATVIPSANWPEETISIEITVTNSITEERLQRIRRKGIPTLEIDISRMGGRVTLDEFKRLVVDEVAGKEWIFHPWLESEKKHLDALIVVEAEQVAKELEESHRLDGEERRLLELPLNELAKLYLDAIEAHASIREKYGTTPAQKAARADAYEAICNYGRVLSKRGFHEAQDPFLFAERGDLLERLLSIKEDRPIGYRVATAGEVINAIKQEQQRFGRWQWHPIYLMAIKTYKPTLSDAQNTLVYNWRKEVFDSLTSGESVYHRVERYDDLLCVLFPEMASAIRTPLPGSKTEVKTPQDHSDSADTHTVHKEGVNPELTLYVEHTKQRDWPDYLHIVLKLHQRKIEISVSGADQGNQLNDKVRGFAQESNCPIRNRYTPSEPVRNFVCEA